MRASRRSRRAERLAAALDHREGARTERTGRADEDPQTRRARLLAGRLEQARPALEQQVVLSDDVRAAQRARLLAAAAAVTPVTPAQAAPPADTSADTSADTARSHESSLRFQAPRHRRRTLVVAGLLAALVGSGGVATAASRSLPGDALYGLKRGAESVQLSLSRSDESRGVRHLLRATTRLGEVRDLTREDPAADEQVTANLLDMDESTRVGTDMLTEVYAAERSEETLRTLDGWATEQRGQLDALLPGLPSASQQQAAASLALLADVGGRASDLLATGTCDCPPGAPGGSCPCPEPPETTEPPEPPVGPPAPSLRPGVPTAPSTEQPTTPPRSTGPTGPAPPTAATPAPPRPGTGPSPSPAPGGPPRTPPPTLPSPPPPPPGSVLPTPPPAPTPTLPLPTPTPTLPLPLPTLPPLPTSVPLPTVPGLPLPTSVPLPELPLPPLPRLPGLP